MSRPEYVIDRRVGAAPETVLAMIRDAAATTRRTALPPPVRKGARGLRARVRDERFTVWVDQIFEGDGTDLHGWVLPDGEGAARVQASVQIERNAGTVVLGLLALAAVLVLAGGQDGWLIAGFAVVMGSIWGIRRAGGFMNHHHAAFLVQWLNGVLDGLPSASPAPPNANPATPDAA
ncbi:MAG TPA: hypothetical protein VLK84_27265 [Longimicrobium sp.]|nr:hypothetical protein [Longimicrobium sp.]